MIRFMEMASQEGFEPPTTRLEGVCSIQLSYWDNLIMANKLRRVKRLKPVPQA